MLTNPMMGALALAILWVNTLLIAAAALQELRRLRRRARSLAGVVEGKVVEGAPLAELRVEQVGRKSDRGAIVFADRSYASAILGGVVEVAGERRTIEATTDAEVWLSTDEVARAHAPESEQAVADAMKEASRARGFARTLRATVEAGARVWIADGLVATIDPRAWLAKRSWLVVGFVVAEVLLAAGCTAVALVPPVFGTVSTIGGALCLAFFLSVQAVGTSVRDAVRVPALRIVRGTWEPSSREAKAGELSASNPA